MVAKQQGHAKCYTSFVFQISTGEIYKELLLTDVDLADSSQSFDWKREFIDMLLDFEEKVIYIYIFFFCSFTKK